MPRGLSLEFSVLGPTAGDTNPLLSSVSGCCSRHHPGLTKKCGQWCVRRQYVETMEWGRHYLWALLSRDCSSITPRPLSPPSSLQSLQPQYRRQQRLIGRPPWCAVLHVERYVPAGRHMRSVPARPWYCSHLSHCSSPQQFPSLQESQGMFSVAKDFTKGGRRSHYSALFGVRGFGSAVQHRQSLKKVYGFPTPYKADRPVQNPGASTNQDKAIGIPPQ